MEKILGFINLHEKLEKVINLQFLACGKRDFLPSKYPKRALITQSLHRGRMKEL